MTRTLVLVAAGLVAAAAAAGAQTLQFQGGGSWMGYQDGSGSREWTGFGWSAGAGVRLGKLRAEVEAQQATVKPGTSGQSTLSSYKLLQVDGRLGFQLSQALSLETGAGRLTADPEFAAQDVGVVRVGLRLEGRVGAPGRVWSRAAYLPVVRFNGGGTASFALELGFGGEWQLSGPFLLRAAYDFRRLDRKVEGVDAPLQVSIARFGVGVGF